MWLSEHEVAERYLRRHLSAQLAADRAEHVVSVALDVLMRASGLWLYVVVVPAVEVTALFNNETVNELKRWYDAHQPIAPCDGLMAAAKGYPAPSRVTFTAGPNRDDETETDARDLYVELHVGGAAFAASPVGFRTGLDDLPGVNTIVNDAIALLDVALQWAAHRAGSRGTARVIIGIVDTDEPGGEVHGLYLIRHVHGLERRAGPRPAHGLVRAETVADLAVVSSHQDRLTVTSVALSRVLQHFGIAEVGHVTEDGAIVPAAFGSYQRNVRHWAELRGVPVI